MIAMHKIDRIRPGAAMALALGIWVAPWAAAAVMPVSPSFPGQSGEAVVSDPAIRPLQGSEPATITASLAVDLRGIGRPDLVVCHGNLPHGPAKRQPCRVLRPQADGTLADVTRALFGDGDRFGGVNSAVIVAGDFNNDGRPDLFLGDGGLDAPPSPGGINGLWISNPDGTYLERSSTLPQTPAYAHDACIGDVNGDGNVDIFVMNISSQMAVGPYFLLGRGDGTFSQTFNRLPSEIANMREMFTACALADLDQDGHPDLILGTHGNNGFLKSIVLPNNGSADFSVRNRYVLPPGPLGEGNTVVQRIGVMDIDGDGKPDLILTSSQYSTHSGFGLQILMNKGGGQFSDESMARVGSSYRRTTGAPFGSPRFQDLNGDGFADFYFSNGPPEEVPRYWINNGDGTFSALAPALLPIGAGYGVSAVHFDSDGRPDLVQVASTPASDIRYRVFRNETPGAGPASFTGLWWNPAESGWGLNLSHQGDILFGTLFTYDTSGAPLWLVMPAGTLQADGTAFAGTLYKTTGPAFNAVPFTPITGANLTAVGTMSVSVTGPSAATVTYSVNGTRVTKLIQPQIYGTRASSCTRVGATAASTNFQDLWWKADESGWGVNVAHQDQTLFATLFTYDASGRATWLVMSAGIKGADGAYSGDLYRLTGPPFSAHPFTPINSSNIIRVGGMQLRFSDGLRGTLSYTVDGASVSKAISRQIFSTPASSCH